MTQVRSSIQWHLRLGVTHPTALLWVFPAILAACLYDKSEPCGADRHLEKTLCVCNEGLVDKDRHCVSPSSVADAGATPADGGPAPAGGLGAACNATTKPCSDAIYSECHLMGGTEGYCTKLDCAAGDCAEG